MKKIITILLVILCVSGSAMAENLSTDSDNAILSLRGRVISPKYYGGLYFHLDQEMRSTSTFGAIKDSRTSVFATYDPCKWFRVSGGYVFLVKEGDDDPSLKHRAVLFVKQMWSWGNFKFALRERLESTFANGYLFDDEVDSEPTNLLRTRLKIKYKSGDMKVVPYIYTELYNHTNDAMTLSRIRSQAGVEYSLSKSSTVTAFYQYAHFTNYTTSTAPHTIGLLYAYKFSK